MSNHKRGRITVQSQPTKKTRTMERIESIPFLVISILFVIIGVVEIIPIFGVFGIIWTVMAGCFVLFAIFHMVRKNGPAYRVGYDVETDLERSIVGMMEDVVDEKSGSVGSTEAKLAELRRMYDNRLITKEEYDAKRKEILERL